MSFARRLRERLSPPYSLSTLLLGALTGLTLIALLLNGLLSYDRLSRETLVTAKRLANSVAALVAGNNTEALILNDIAAVESNLVQVIQLPGVDAIAVIRADRRLLVEVSKKGDASVSRIGGQVALPAFIADSQVPQDRLDDSRYEAWSGIGMASGSPLGWVRVQYSLEQRRLELERLWKKTLWGLLLTIALILAVLPFIINLVLRPIRRLSDITGNLSTQLGHRFAIDATSLEARRLADALNKASHDVAEQVARVQVIVNTAAVAIISLDDKGQVISANPATTSIFGREESELLGLPLERCVPGLNEELLRSLCGGLGDIPGRVYRIVRNDFFGTRIEGTRFPIEISLGQTPVGGNLRYVCIVRDVTDERAAQETTELYERALASSHNGVFITNATVSSQPIIFINEALQKITGLAAPQVLGRGLDLLLDGNRDEEGSGELRRAITEERSTSVTVQNVLSKYLQLTAEVSLSPVRSAQGTLTNFVGIVSDVTARVQAEQAMAERSAQLDAIFSLSPDGFVLFDAEGGMMFANPAFERMTGRSWQKDGQTITLEAFEATVASLCHPEHPLPSLKAPVDGVRLLLSRPQHRVVLTQSRRNIAGRGETILYFRDVTHEDEVDRMKSEFLASAAHELRTPMVSIFGFTELLIKRQFSDERRADMLQTIHRQSGLLVKMINELLDLARIESRRGLDLHIGEHPLSELVRSSVKGLMRKDDERQVSVGRLPDVPVLIDPEKMQLALNNLLSNAFKYSPQGGEVTLTAHCRVQDGCDYVVLEVRDEGIGMTPEQLTRAFERFYRADASGNIPGSGLGLSLVKEIAELHNGRVELQSVAGRGTTSRLWIPTSANSVVDAYSSPPG